MKPVKGGGKGMPSSNPYSSGAGNPKPAAGTMNFADFI